ncbi:MAG: hypothetical protein LBE95_03200 [Holosporaceae bacterium]|jgi:hypothetical protein|nr:hypothetical protein [Holosporaceae bacterium]
MVESPGEGRQDSDSIHIVARSPATKQSKDEEYWKTQTVSVLFLQSHGYIAELLVAQQRSNR